MGFELSGKSLSYYFSVAISRFSVDDVNPDRYLAAISLMREGEVTC